VQTVSNNTLPERAERMLSVPRLSIPFLIALQVPLLIWKDADVVEALSVSVQYRRGHKSDERAIATTLAKELMNPLGIQSDRFVVATRQDGNVIGWAQIKPLGALTTMDPSRFDARPGSYDLEQELDDAMWDDFEKDDSIKVPAGLKSLPWTREYRAMEESVKGRQKKREKMRVQRAKELQQQQLWELASVYVQNPYRGQGIGTELVKRVLKKRFSEDACLPSSIYCLTLATTVDWYRDNFGFEIVSSTDVPAPMALEVTAGSIITKLIGAQLCCMRGTPKTLEICKNVPSAF
jgi:N-acetylglutamate synthase-like GNAT family acetyltransferase